MTTRTPIKSVGKKRARRAPKAGLPRHRLLLAQHGVVGRYFTVQLKRSSGKFVTRLVPRAETEKPVRVRLARASIASAPPKTADEADAQIRQLIHAHTSSLDALSKL
jgi:hypothetical protein